MRNPNNPKERNLAKGALRRVFSRSELRRQALQKNLTTHEDPNRPRVTKWTWCNECGEVFPAYLANVDHVDPVIPVNKTLEDLTWDQLVDRLWCDIDNLQVLCKPCHLEKSKRERKARKNVRQKL